MDPLPQHFNHFFHFAQNMGADILENVDLKILSPDNRTLVAKKNFCEGETVIFIPEKLVISYETIEKMPFQNFIKSKKKLMRALK